MALVVKVVKNVFVAAIEIKEENDLTVWGMKWEL
jgi:hypothetical protein